MIISHGVVDMRGIADNISHPKLGFDNSMSFSLDKNEIVISNHTVIRLFSILQHEVSKQNMSMASYWETLSKENTI